MAHQRRTNASAVHFTPKYAYTGGELHDESERPAAVRMTNLAVLPESEILSPNNTDFATDNGVEPFDSNKHLANAKTQPLIEDADDPASTDDGLNRKTATKADDDELDASTTGHFLTVMNMIKANVGTGILAMPLAFSHSGLLMGVVYMFVLGIICVNCMHMVVRAAQYFKRVTNTPQLSYPDVANLAFLHSPWKRLANAMRLAVAIFLLINQLGVCCVYIVFVSRTIENILQDYNKMFNIRYLELMSAPAFLLLVMVRQMKRLAGLMMLANIIVFGKFCFGLFLPNVSADTVFGAPKKRLLFSAYITNTAALICVWQEVVRHLQPFSSLPQTGGVADFARFFSTAVFAFEGIGCVLPVENKMTRPETFGGRFGVLNQAMIVVALLYTITGFFGFWGFGRAVQASITYSLPASPVYDAVKIGMALAVFLSYGLQFYVPIKMAAFAVRKRWMKNASNFRILMAEYGLRVGLMLFTLLLALFIPYLGLFIDLMGAFAGTNLALILPPLIDMVYRYDMNILDGANARRRYGRFRWILIKDVVFLLFGLAGFVLGTYLAVHDIVLQIVKDAGVGGNASLASESVLSGNQTANIPYMRNDKAHLLEGKPRHSP